MGSILFSNNVTNFIGAKILLTELYTFSENTMSEFVLGREYNMGMIPPNSPRFGELLY